MCDADNRVKCPLCRAENALSVRMIITTASISLFKLISVDFTKIPPHACVWLPPERSNNMWCETWAGSTKVNLAA